MDKTFEVYKISTDSSIMSRYKTIKAHNKKVKANSLKLSFFWLDVEAFAPFSQWSFSQDYRLNVSLKLAQDDPTFRVVWKIRVVKSLFFLRVWACLYSSSIKTSRYLTSGIFDRLKSFKKRAVGYDRFDFELTRIIIGSTRASAQIARVD